MTANRCIAMAKDCEHEWACGDFRELFEFARSLARCPCCEQHETCHEECEYADDAKPYGLALMREARAAIAASPFGVRR